MVKNALRNFTIKFFQEIGAKVAESDEALLVSQVPLKFQKFYGKNEPYTIAFDNHHSLLSAEIVTSESYLLKTMRSYLDNTGESVLQKLFYSLQADSLIKSKLVLRNCVISKINNTLAHRPFVKFTFQTTYKYLNDEERIVSDVFVDKNKIITPNFSKFRIDSVKNKEFEMLNLRESYEFAKSKIKDLVSSKTNSIAKQLEENLSKEVQRVNDHSLQQIREVDSHISKARVKNVNFDVSAYETQKKQFISERDLQIANEEKKYSLRVNTKLLTTAVILSPTYDFEVFFKNQKNDSHFLDDRQTPKFDRHESIVRLVLISYDPLYDDFIFPSCDLCRKSLNEVILCNGNHLVCRECGAECEDCGKISCNQCLKQKCAVTHRKICKQCGQTCLKCKIFKNKRFMVLDSVGRYTVCRTCG